MSWESWGTGSMGTRLRKQPGSQSIFLRATLAGEVSTPCPILRDRGWDSCHQESQVKSECWLSGGLG